MFPRFSQALLGRLVRTARGGDDGFGIALPTAAEAWKVVRRAEELGFTHAWFYDTQMLSADCFVAMGAAAVNTRRIRLGTGVLVPSNRIAPVAANALATLNKMRLAALISGSARASRHGAPWVSAR